MKFVYRADCDAVFAVCVSLPVRGAWVEILLEEATMEVPLLSLPVRGAWVEMLVVGLYYLILPASLPVRGAWVEIST